MGAVEVANRLVEGQIRTIRGPLAEVLKIDIHITDPRVPWVVRYASWLLKGHRIKLDCCTPYFVIKGRPDGGEVNWRDQVYWKVLGFTHK